MFLTQREFASLLRFHFEKIAREEDANLQQQGKSVHSIPELAFGYLLGKSILADINRLLKSRQNELKISIIYEYSDQNYPGLCDLVFTINHLENGYSERHFIELKVDDTYHKYGADLGKLFTFYEKAKNNSQETNYLYFCALEDLFYWQKSRTEIALNLNGNKGWDETYLNTVRIPSQTKKDCVIIGSIISYPKQELEIHPEPEKSIKYSLPPLWN
jgi:hypothetical protein